MKKFEYLFLEHLICQKNVFKYITYLTLKFNYMIYLYYKIKIHFYKKAFKMLDAT